MSGFDFELYFQFQKAMEQRESDPDESIRLLTKVREDAIERNNFEWRLIADHWRTQVYINWKKDYNTASRLAVEAAVESRQPEYHEFREYICVQNDLLLVYKGIDPVGYADEIKEALDLTINMTTPDMACHFCLNRGLIDYHKYIGEDENAREQCAKFYAMTYQEPHYRIQAYEQMTEFAYDDKTWEDLLSLAQQGALLAGEEEDESSWIDLKSYEMIELYHLGRVDEAQKAHDLIQYRVSTLKMVQGYTYYSLMSAYHEAQGNFDSALSIIDDYLVTLKDTGRPYWQCKAQLERIRLQKLLGQDYETDVTEFKSLTAKLKAPAQFDARLAAIIKD